jgi:beta-phosphoglucomutase-like phosphatase (HAD superfamily)
VRQAALLFDFNGTLSDDEHIQCIRTLELLHRRSDEALAFEDSEAGVAAVKAAGVYRIALEGTVEIARLAAADEIVGALDVELMQRLLR